MLKSTHHSRRSGFVHASDGRAIETVRAQPACPRLGPLALRMYWRRDVPDRPVRFGARTLSTNRVVGQPLAGLTMIRALPTPEAPATGGAGNIASVAKGSTNFRDIVAICPRDPA